MLDWVSRFTAKEPRPYEERLNEASQAGRVLKRADIYGSGPPVDALSHETRRLVKKYCSQSVVDLGAGCGALQRYLPESCAYLGIEANPAAVEMAKANGRNVVLGDLNTTGLGDSSFHVCAMIEVLEHIEDYESALREVHRVCASHLLMTVPNIGVLPRMSKYHVVPWHMLEASHVNFFTPGSLEKMLARFFSRVKVWPINGWYSRGLYMNVAAVAWK